MIERLVDAGRALEAGRLEQAERIYRQVVDSDPRSSIAIVGLARVADRRGDGVGAVRLAEAALLIDPGNAAARRLMNEQNARHASAGPANDGDAATTDEDEAWPWPDLEAQLARHRAPGLGPLGRLIRRGRA